MGKKRARNKDSEDDDEENRFYKRLKRVEKKLRKAKKRWHQSKKLIIAGDSNINFSSDEAEPLILFSREKLNLRMNTNRNIPTTNSDTTIDAVFSRYLGTLQSQFSAMLNLFVPVLKLLLGEELYPATAAALGSCIHAGDKGLVVQVYGFNQKLPLLLTTLTKYVANFSDLVTEDLFDVIKGELLKEYYNTFVKPSKLSKDVRMSILMDVYWSSLDEHAATADIDFQKFKNYVKYLTQHVYIKCLVQGNISSDRVIENVKKCIEILNCGPLLPNTMPQLRVTQIPLGERCCRVKNFNPTDSNSIVTNYYQSDETSIKTSVLVELMIMIMEEPMFNQLRTQEQLGYNVSCTIRETFGVLGFSIKVCMQANKYTPEHVDERIEAFLTSFKKTLNEMSEKELSSVKEALTKEKQCTDIHLMEEVDRNWAEIISGEYVFDRLAREVDAISGIKIEELRKWITRHTAGGSNFRKLSVQVVGNDGREEESTDKPEEQGNEISQSDDKKMNNAAVKYGGKVEYPLQYLNDILGEKKKKPDYYINNIEEYKQSLYLFPMHKCTS